MGDSRQVRRARAIHTQKLFGGRYSAEEVHAKYAFPPGMKCMCGAPPVARAIVMIPLDEARKRDPDVDLIMQYRPQDLFKMLVQLKGADGLPIPHLRVSTTYACKQCLPTMEKQLAKGPSWAVVEINRGVTPGRFISGVNGSSEV